MTFAPGYQGFLNFAAALDVELHPFQRKITRAVFGDAREVVVVIPRGNGKTSLCALIALHHLVTVPDASVSLGAASRAQASIAFKVMCKYAEHPILRRSVVARTMELRTEAGGALRVVSGKGHSAHGLTDSLMLLDELWSVTSDGLLEAFQTALVKRPDSRLIVISTAASALDSPLGRLRTRALSGEVRRKGALADARADGIRWLEWGVADELPLDLRNVKRANPAPWMSSDALREQKDRVTPMAFAQFHACRWGVGEAAWLPVGAWAACAGQYEVGDGERVWLGVDVGGSRAASAVVGVTEDLRVAVCETYQGNESVLEITAALERLADQFEIVEVAYDPWRYSGEALRLGGRLLMVEFPQSHARMTVASERLHSVVVEQKLRHPNDSALNRHVAGAVAKATGRGWRLDKSERSAQIDAVVALAMAVERASVPVPPLEVLAWI